MYLATYVSCTRIVGIGNGYMCSQFMYLRKYIDRCSANNLISNYIDIRWRLKYLLGSTYHYSFFSRRSSQSTHRNTETHSAPGSPKFERKFPITTTTAITTITSTAATPAAPTATATAANTACSLNSPQQQQQLLFSENVIVQQNDSKHFQNQQSTIYQQQQSSQDQESNGQHER